MISDIKITDSGDIEIDSATGDIAVTNNNAFESYVGDATTISQLALISIKTERGDFSKHPAIGSILNTLIGFPNKPTTAGQGKKYIIDALRSIGITSKVIIESWPEDLNTIGYEVKIALGQSKEMLTFTMYQTLTNSGVEV